MAGMAVSHVGVKTTMALESAIVMFTAYFCACFRALSNRVHDLVQRGARAHGLARQIDIRTVVTADVHRLALCRAQLCDDLRFGGDSLLATQFVARVIEALGVDVSVVDFLAPDGTTVANFARAIASRQPRVSGAGDATRPSGVRG
jgi:hypothetical protein